MKTKPLVLVALIITAVVVSTVSGVVIGGLNSRWASAQAHSGRLDHMREFAGGVAKVAVRVLVCRR